MLMAMAEYQLGQHSQAGLELVKCRETVEKMFNQKPVETPGKFDSTWYDSWINYVLLQEAETLIEGAPEPLANAPAYSTNSAATFASQLAEAQKMAGGITAAAVFANNASRRAAIDLFRALGSWQLSQRQFPEAVSNWNILLYGPGISRSLVDQRGLIDLYLRYAPVVIANHDTVAYEKMRDSALAKFGGTTNATLAEAVLVSCQLAPAGPGTTNVFPSLLACVANSVDTRSSEKTRIWSTIAIAQTYYRQGNYEQAIQLLNNDDYFARSTPVQIARTQVLMAMTEYQLGQRAEAEAELAKCREAIESNFNERPFEKTGGDLWYDWWMDHVFLREAETLIDGGTKRADKI
jgi:tetratricopeptide (TPR) repeat protein